MINRVFLTIGFKLKYSLFFCFSLVTLVFFGYLLLSFSVFQRFNLEYQAIIEVVYDFPFWIWGVPVLCLFFFFFVLYLLEQFYLRLIFKKVSLVLEEKKLVDYFGHFLIYSSPALVHQHLLDLLELNQTFEHLKNNRISQEMNTIQLLFDHMTEGVLFLSADKIVTHVNRSAETLLRLIPDEIVGQHVSRKITHPDVLASIHALIENDKKWVNKEIEIEGQSVLLSTLPIKDRLDHLLRIVLIFRFSS